ncbi:chitin deacetylase [Steroidobacter denitrificans]|uniref:Chitin deacetylase n=1 Tax=Steroidobacter denitrificans TaxID=465721 RepID=A0A127F7R5_STEDE|nr:polysaccharide deacetylase family protein [Steroidobacter denitrificans]AMN46464.1 chitin deacetylase [Steroidobacter denitrificans]
MLSTIALKVDVDTLRGTCEGVPRLMALLERLQVQASFLFSLGPDHTGRAVRRILRRGFVGKLRRTSVVSHYGLRTLLYGTFLPGPHIGNQCAAQMRAVMRKGFEVGVHAYDHVKWQDGVAGASLDWTRAELIAARDVFADIFGYPPTLHGSAGWQMNRYVPSLQRELGFKLASDTRGDMPFIPPGGIVQLPTTLPTLDELIGRDDLPEPSPIDTLLRLTRTSPLYGHVYTLHAEIEGGAYLGEFERLLQGWRQQEYRFVTLGMLGDSLEKTELARCELRQGTVPGRAGVVAIARPSRHQKRTGSSS